MSGAPILVVDDNPANLKLIRYILDHRGYQVHTAINAEEALGILATCRPAVILMDLQLPGIDGFELTRRIKADPTTRDIPVLAVTGYAMKGDAERARAAGCDDFITKPIDIQELPELVARYAQGRLTRG